MKKPNLEMRQHIIDVAKSLMTRSCATPPISAPTDTAGRSKTVPG
ncbi:hypothetical protein [Pseudomonas sp. W2-17]